MTERPTFDQNAPLPDAPLLLEASAGTGKTYSIAHLFARLVVERGLAVDSILVVTFTEAATAELRDRVRRRLRDAERVFRRGFTDAGPGRDKALEAWLQTRHETREADADRLRDALLDFDRAAISTIHGFCRRMLLRNAFESGTPFGVELGGEDKALREEVVRDFRALEVHARGPGRAKALHRYGWLSWLGGLASAVADPDVVLLPQRPESEDIEGAPHRFAAYLRRELAARKAARHVRSYDDLLRELRDALLSGEQKDELRRVVRQQFQAALIDEFQDTDPVQWAIFEAVFLHGGGRSPLYLIGDPKQAIYGFRGADLRTYLGARDQVQAAGAVCVLKQNHRSDPRLLRGFNALFGGHDDPFAHPEIGYIDVDPASDADPPGDPPLELRFVPRTQGQPNLPGIVAADVARAVAEGPVAAGEHAILVRTKQQAREVQGALRALRVPSVLHGAHSVFESAEAESLADILAAMHEPGDSALVKRALATPVIGLQAADLHRLETEERGWESWVGSFREWNRIWHEESFIRAFRRLLSDKGLPATLLARVDGERAMTNLQHLSEMLHRVATRERLRPAALLEWLRRHRDDPGDDDVEQIRLESDDDAIEILTIHGAKGLEFGAVWVPFLLEGRGLFRKDKAFLRCRHDGRPAVNYAQTTEKSGAIAAAERDARAEELRLLYVALTRAKHRCTLYWGGLHESGHASPVAWLLHGRRTGRADFAAFCNRMRSLSDEDLLEGLRALESEAIRVTVADAEPAWTAADAPKKPAVLKARQASRTRVDSLWRRTSFTGLTRGELHGPLPVQDFDAVEDEEDAEDLVAEVEEARVGLADFRAGALVGTCLHEILEHHDFRAPDALGAQVARSIELHGLDPEDAPRVTSALQAALEARFDGMCLAEVAPADRLNELEFTFAVGGGLAPTIQVTREALADVYDAHGRRQQGASVRALSFDPFGGFLTGSIDLVFRHRGVWSLADYKSNHLGPAPSDYAPGRLAEAMMGRHYFLQAHLYTVALHRYLGHRLPDYDYDRHVGAAYYLFLRGMDPAFAPGNGVHRERLDAGLVHALSEALS